MFHRSRHLLTLLLLSIHLLFPFSSAVSGTAAQYTGPYIPTACFGNDASQLPANLQFAMVDKWIWRNGEVCGRQIYVTCIRDGCISNETIKVRVVDNAETAVAAPSSRGANLVLSQIAFSSIADATAQQIKIEYTWLSELWKWKQSRGVSECGFDLD